MIDKFGIVFLEQQKTPDAACQYGKTAPKVFQIEYTWKYEQAHDEQYT
jgi:hypothetical protein